MKLAKTKNEQPENDNEISAPSPLRALIDMPQPVRGWIHLARTSLKMTTGQLAERMGVAQSRINELEGAEVSKSATLQSLDRAARAMGCRFVYGIVSEKPLNDMVADREQWLYDYKLNVIVEALGFERDAIEKTETFQNIKRDLLNEVKTRRTRLWEDLD